MSEIDRCELCLQPLGADELTLHLQAENTRLRAEVERLSKDYEALMIWKERAEAAESRAAAAEKDARRWRYRVTVELLDRQAEESRVDAAMSDSSSYKS